MKTLNVSVPAQEGTDFVAVTLPEGSRDSALAGGGSSGSPRSCWICVGLRPAFPAGGVFGIFTPGVNQLGFTCPLLFLWTRKPEITGCSGDRSRSGERALPDFGRGSDFLRAGEIVLPPPRRNLFGLFSVLCVRFQHQSSSSVPPKSIRVIRSPPPALPPPGLLAVR